MYAAFKLVKEQNGSDGFSGLLGMLIPSEVKSNYKMELYIEKFYDDIDELEKDIEEKQDKELREEATDRVKEALKYPNLDKNFSEMDDDSIIASVNILILEVPRMFGFGFKKSQVDVDAIKEELSKEKK